ncbi:hypothetical protein PM082_016337 [Marasmius tenuissimus]|nr:hypothetical protein PM082_016337 [Marasmius tenuissimus]
MTMFANSHDFKITGGHFSNVHGNQHTRTYNGSTTITHNNDTYGDTFNNSSVGSISRDTYNYGWDFDTNPFRRRAALSQERTPHAQYMPSPYAKAHRSRTPAPAVYPHPYDSDHLNPQPGINTGYPSRNYHPDDRSEDGHIFAHRCPSPQRVDRGGDTEFPPLTPHLLSTRENEGSSTSRERLHEWVNSPERRGSPVHVDTTTCAVENTWPYCDPEAFPRINLTANNSPIPSHIYPHSEGTDASRSHYGPGPEEVPDQTKSAGEDLTITHIYSHRPETPQRLQYANGRASPSPPSHPGQLETPSDAASSRGLASERHWDADDEYEETSSRRTLSGFCASPSPLNLGYAPSDATSSRGPASESHWDADDETDNVRRPFTTTRPAKAQGHIQRFLDMGFLRGDVLRCMSASNNLPDLALEYLIDGIPSGLGRRVL